MFFVPFFIVVFFGRYPLGLSGSSGRIPNKGTKRKYFYGEFNVYVKDATGKSVRKHRGKFLGYKSEMTKGDAEDKLQRIIFEETGHDISASDKVTLAWFWANRFEPMRESGWEEATKDVNIRDFEHYMKPKLGTKTLAEFDKFVLQLHLNALAKGELQQARDSAS